MKLKIFTANIILTICLILGDIEVCCGNVCYKSIGCFSQDSPWVSESRPFPPPKSPNDVNVTLWFFSREQPDGKWINIYPNIELNVEGFSPDRRTVTITHGFSSSAYEEWVIDMKTAYLKNLDANIFLVNWENGAKGINYLQAAANTRVAGAVLGRFGVYLIEEKKVPYANFHMIGHSLGSHIAGYASDIMNKASDNKSKVKWITGLDVAQPGYQNLPVEVRLNKDNAEFLETVHSDAKPFFPYFGFGYLTSLGNIDFFLNRGYDQPECLDVFPLMKMSSIFSFVNVTEEMVSQIVSCSHGRSHEVYTASIDPDVKCKFTGHRIITRDPITSNQSSCGNNNEDCVDLNLNTPNQPIRGSFQVMTSGTKPFCCPHYTPEAGCQNKTSESIFKEVLSFFG